MDPRSSNLKENDKRLEVELIDDALRHIEAQRVKFHAEFVLVESRNKSSNSRGVELKTDFMPQKLRAGQVNKQFGTLGGTHKNSILEKQPKAEKDPRSSNSRENDKRPKAELVNDPSRVKIHVGSTPMESRNKSSNSRGVEFKIDSMPRNSRYEHFLMLEKSCTVLQAKHRGLSIYPNLCPES
ncbi:hypothetical protein CDL15_Pgr004076 [Punica granatum]|uniref:Uncharacterized protein n=1 Tax=Punica granatum TaxID=22663 RepID=A0A218XFB4_PUNGR|nr:hypothetical protein CDL15_Pgr004076 [Punica granatum]